MYIWIRLSYHCCYFCCPLLSSTTLSVTTLSVTACVHLVTRYDYFCLFVCLLSVKIQQIKPHSVGPLLHDVHILHVVRKSFDCFHAQSLFKTQSCSSQCVTYTFLSTWINSEYEFLTYLHQGFCAWLPLLANLDKKCQHSKRFCYINISFY